MNILRRQTQNAVDTPEGVNQLREFGLLVGKQNRVILEPLRGMEISKDEAEEACIKGVGEQTTTAANPADLQGKRMHGMAKKQRMSKRKRCKPLTSHARGT